MLLSSGIKSECNNHEITQFCEIAIPQTLIRQGLGSHPAPIQQGLEQLRQKVGISVNVARLSTLHLGECP
jgi:hypothetical protein